MKSLIDLLRDPSVSDLEVDAENRLILHREILQRKRMLREVFLEFHDLFQRLDKQYFTAKGMRVEIGAGVSPIRDSYPDVVATDVVYDRHLDRVLDAEAMDLESGSVRAIFGQNCFHHFLHPDRFFRELERVLAPGGGAVILDPYYGPFAAFLFKRLFRVEGYDKTYPSWETPVDGPMNGANQALSYIIFKRDRAEYELKYPSLKIVHEETIGNYPRYLLSGGLNFRQLCPNALIPFVKFIELLLRPMNRWLSLHHVVVIRKEAA